MKTKMKTKIKTAVRIKAAFGYYLRTYNAPKDGYLMSHPSYDGHTGREYCAPIEFDTVEDAFDYLTNKNEWEQDAMFCEYHGDGDFSKRGIYYTSHGQHSRPVYSIVSAKSGRCNKEIKAACDRIQAANMLTDV